MRKWQLVFSIVISVILSFNALRQQQRINMTLSFSEAVATAIEHNLDLKLSRLNLEKRAKTMIEQSSSEMRTRLRLRKPWMSLRRLRKRQKPHPQCGTCYMDYSPPKSA